MTDIFSKMRGKPFFHCIRHPYVATSEHCRQRRNAKDKERLLDKAPTILCNDCLAGVILSDYNLPCNTPIINCGIKPVDYIRFLQNIEHYISCDLVEKKCDSRCPIGELVSPLGNIEIEFTHYTSFKEAKMLWKRRCKRINLNKTYVILDVNKYNYTTEDYIEQFNRLPYRKIVITTEERFKDLDGCFYIDLGKKKDVAGLLLENKDILGHRYYNEFDFISWLNQGTSR